MDSNDSPRVCTSASKAQTPCVWHICTLSVVLGLTPGNLWRILITQWSQTSLSCDFESQGVPMIPLRFFGSWKHQCFRFIDTCFLGASYSVASNFISVEWGSDSGALHKVVPVALVNHPSWGRFLLFTGQFCRSISQQLGKVHDRTG